MSSNIGIQVIDYFIGNIDGYLASVQEHIWISLLAVATAIVIGVPCGYASVKHKKYERRIVSIFQVLRIVPSLAVLILLIPVMGTGLKPAVTALVLLAVPPILMNTSAGLDGVPDFMIETAYGMGMTDSQVLWKVKFPLAMPLILTGIKSAMIEIIASATLASKIGAGGIGDIIFTGLGLNRTDLLLIGGISVEIRYEPEWLNDVTKAIPIYEDGKKTGEARVVRFHDNAHAMRRFKGSRRKDIQPEAAGQVPSLPEATIKNSISYSDMMGSEK